MSKRNQSTQVAQVKQLILGTKKHFPDASAELQFGGSTFTVTALTELLQSFVDQRESVEASKAVTKTKIESMRTRAASQIAVRNAFVAFVKGRYGNSADVLGDFGLAPPKARVPVSAEKKAAAAAKRTATRAARHTMGKNQKKSVKGSVTATLVVTPVPGPNPAAPAGTPTPHIG